MTNRFAPFTTPTLIKAIQRSVVLLSTPEGKKENKIRQQLYEMRAEVIPRLLKMNRFDPLFFPVEVHVQYHKYQPPQAWDDWGPSVQVPDRFGVVTGHDGEHVLVRLEGEVNDTKIKPEDLKIIYIR